MPIKGTTRLAGLFGYPVEHSVSPQMHNAAFEALGLDWCYVAFSVRPADLVVLAAPPGATLNLLRDLQTPLKTRPALCTDVTSVKRPIMDLAERLALADVFAGSHPLAGTHESGFAAARPSRLDGALVYVTPLPNGERVAREIADFWAGVCGASPVVCDAAAHDRIVAWTSHLPQAVASALAGALRRAGPKGVTYGPGARDTTRLAASNPELWHDVMLLNREALLEGLDAVEGELGHLRHALNTGNGDELLAWLGPAIGPESFEVGPEVRAAFVQHDAQAVQAFHAAREGKYLADIYLLAHLRLQRLGVAAVYGGGFCTVTESARFFSYRRDGATGRMASLIWLADG